MNQEEEAELAGRATPEMAESERYLAFLQAAASRIGKELSSLGSMLQRSAELCFDGREYNVNVAESLATHRPDREIVGSIIKLTNDIRTTIDRVEDLRNQAARLGIRPAG